MLSKAEWEERTQRRVDRNMLVEHFCEHGIGHPNPGSALWIAESVIARRGESDLSTVNDLNVDKEWKAQMVHGCDGCCGQETFPGLADSLKRAHKIIRLLQQEVN